MCGFTQKSHPKYFVTNLAIHDGNKFKNFVTGNLVFVKLKEDTESQIYIIFSKSVLHNFFSFKGFNKRLFFELIPNLLRIKLSNITVS